MQSDTMVWLDDLAGNRVAIRGSCSLGRSASNQVALPDEKVSRRHALIHAQEQNAYWLVDLGSRNGTYLNGRRVIQPTRLRHGDQIGIGPFQLTFQQPLSTRTVASDTMTSNLTVAEIKKTNCWLLIADIVGSTQLTQTVPADELPVIIGRWLAECKQTIEEHGGSIKQYLGDGFFAFWFEREHTEVAVDGAMQALKRLQLQSQPAFRIAVHYGQVVTGGESLGEESLMGPEVHFVFRMEKLAGSLKELRLMSEAAWTRLAALVEARDIGQHALPGFEHKCQFYAF